MPPSGGTAPRSPEGRDPNRKQSQEQPKASFHRAAHYPDEPSSELPYNQAQQAIYETPCDLSAYRLRPRPDYAWHVAVLGSPPPEGLLRRIEEILATGEPVTLSDEVLSALTVRRLQQIQRGPWVEGHYGKRRRTTR